MSKYNIDLDYVIPEIDISWEELKEIEAEADKIITENKESNENLAVAYLKKAQIERKKVINGTYLGYIFYDQPNLWLLAKEKKEIKKLLEKTLEFNPNMPEMLMQLGLLNNPVRGYKRSTINYISKAIQLKPDYAAAYNNRAMLFYDIDFFVDKNDKEELENNKIHYKNAIADLTEAIKIRPYDAIYFLNRGYFHSKLQQHKEAVKDFSNAINHVSDKLKERIYKKILVFNLRGKEYMELKDYGKAIDDFSETLSLKQDDKENYETLLMHSKAFYLAGEKDKAKADIEEYLNRKHRAAETANRNEIISIVGVIPEEILLSEEKKQEVKNLVNWFFEVN